jgi:methionyl-tRNA synthetase
MPGEEKMSEQTISVSAIQRNRPVFPKRAVITGGMPYGNKDLHFGHIGGVFVHADVFSRFLRDRIGKENVIFVSGTDCYGSPIVEHYRQVTESGDFEGDIREFVTFNYGLQKEALDSYNIGLNIFAASGLGRSGEIHSELSKEFFKTLHKNGHLVKLTNQQFYDSKFKVFLNGRQVVGRCPIPGCASEKGYADECSLGHPYEPKELINPTSALSGDVPEMRSVSNWYIDLVKFRPQLEKWLKTLHDVPGCRGFMVSAIQEFLEPPTIYVKLDQLEALDAVKDQLPEHKRKEGKNKTIPLIFDSLEKREIASSLLTKHSIRYRNGKTLVPFRLTGNIEWSIPCPDIEGLTGLTFWVWPESLWAPISFTATYLESQGKQKDDWKKWWCSKDAQVYQFIGEDNIYFYSLAEISMFMGDQGKEFSFDPEEGQLQLPKLIANNHILFFDKKASSSGKLKPPMARELLNYYTAEQLRAHFFALGLGIRSVGFQPKPLNPAAHEKDADPVLKEGNLLCNVFNRAIRSCFYTAQKYHEGRIPVGEVSKDIHDESNNAILNFEEAMYRHEFHQASAIVDNFIRGMNKRWDEKMRSINQSTNQSNDEKVRTQIVVDGFHMLRVASVLMHPLVPAGTSMILEYLNMGEEFWNWDRIFDPIYKFMDNPACHQLKFLEPRVDFFKKHPSQLQAG